MFLGMPVQKREFKKLISLFKLDGWDIGLLQTKQIPYYADEDDVSAVSFNPPDRTAQVWAPNVKGQRSNVIHELLHLLFEDSGVEVDTEIEHRVIYTLEDVLAKVI